MWGWASHGLLTPERNIPCKRRDAANRIGAGEQEKIFIFKLYYYFDYLCTKYSIMEENNIVTFEDFKNQNGITFWWASDLMRISFQKVINRATRTLITLNIPHYDNIISVERMIDGKSVRDFKLTRFACYILAMNGDTKKPEVAMAQAYFAEQTRKFEVYIQSSNDVDRLLIRDELTDGNKSLASTAKAAGVVDYAKFQNAGYRGMYNMMSYQLENRRGVKRGHLPDTMSRTELAANLFRVTQTEENIKRNNISGQEALERTHYAIGKEVRRIVEKNTGLAPEDLPQERRLPDVKKDLKIGYREMKKKDKE